MRALIIVCFVLAISACAGLEEFEQTLDGPTATAWKTCLQDMQLRPAEPPTSLIVDEDRILFVWSNEAFERDGGPVLCSTSGQGTEVLEYRVAGSPFGGSQ